MTTSATGEFRPFPSDELIRAWGFWQVNRGSYTVRLNLFFTPDGTLRGWWSHVPQQHIGWCVDDADRKDLRTQRLYPINPDGTPVPWEEVEAMARVAAEPATAAAPIKVGAWVVTQRFTNASGVGWNEAMLPLVGKAGEVVIVNKTIDGDKPYVCVQHPECGDRWSWPLSAITLASTEQVTATTIAAAPDDFRPGCPSPAHIAAARRLGLLWGRDGYDFRYKFLVDEDAVRADSEPFDDDESRLEEYEEYVDEHERATWQPCRDDDEQTAVAWSVVETEAARVGKAAVAPATMPTARSKVGDRVVANDFPDRAPLLKSYVGKAGEIVTDDRTTAPFKIFWWRDTVTRVSAEAAPAAPKTEAKVATATATQRPKVGNQMVLSDYAFNSANDRQFAGVPTHKAKDTQVSDKALPTSAISKHRTALEEALTRAPVALALDEAHDLVVKLALRSVKNKAHKPIIRAWLEEQLQSDYGKAVLGAGIASMAPIAAPYIGEAGPVVDRMSMELLTHSYTTAIKKLGKSALHMFKPFLGVFSRLAATVKHDARDELRGSLMPGSPSAMDELGVDVTATAPQSQPRQREREKVS